MDASSMDPRRLYRELVEIEKQLRELLRSNPLNAQDANVLRHRLMEKAQLLAQTAPAFAAARELEQVLWKPCFYKRIEDFRRRIRKYASAPSSDRSVRDHFAKVSHEFQEFLKNAGAFYENLRESYTKWLLQHRVTRIVSSSANFAKSTNSTNFANFSNSTNKAANATNFTNNELVESTEKCRTSLHRCLVFLGDLARYRELHSQKAKKNFAAAEQFYYKALAVIPENGNPHNQLAVLATYVEAETVAVYRYCRSLLIAQPFVTAEENLALLFERSRQRPLAPPTLATSSSSLTSNSPTKDKALALKSLLHRFTRLHGILFSLATVTSPTNPTSSAKAPTVVYSKEMESLVMKDLLLLLPTGAVGDALLIKLVVTNIFCIEKAATDNANSTNNTTNTPTKIDALRLSVRMVTVVMEYVLSVLTSEGTVTQEGTAPPMGVRLLGPVSTFLDYLRANARVVSQIDEIMSREDDEELNKRVVKDWLEKLVQLLNHSQSKAAIDTSTPTSSPTAVQDQRLQLQENVELRGFKPLASAVPVDGNRWREDLATGSVASTTKSELSETDAWRVRVWNLHAFAQLLCDEYSLLYCYKGVFSTAPSVVTDVALHGLGVTTTGANGASSADDFDDEIIVYQPSPALTPSQPRLGSDPFSLSLSGSSSSVFSASGLLSSKPVTGGGGGRLFGGSLGSSLNSNSSSSMDSAAISSSLGYPGFSSFAPPGQSFMASPWQSNVGTQQPHSAKPPVTTSSLSSEFHSGHASLFAAMDDLAAIERESALYQQEASSLSAFLNPSRLTTSAAAPPAPAWGGGAVRSSSVGSSRPPPGFGNDAAVRSPPLQPQAQFFTRNPFANP